MRCRVVSFSITISFDFSDVVKYTKVLLSSMSITISRFCMEWRSFSSSLSLSRSMMRRYRRYIVALRYRICRMKRERMKVLKPRIVPSMNGWSTGVSCMQTVMMRFSVTMIDSGMVSYQSRPPRSSTVGMSTMIIV